MIGLLYFEFLKTIPERKMPKVKMKSGKVKHYPYTKKGKAAAKQAKARKK